ncbi:hypothetical protein D3C77_664470 [compost metagenome]
MVLILPHIELGSGHPSLAMGCMHHERVQAVVLYLEESLAFYQRDPALILVVGKAQLAIQVQLHLTAVRQHDMADGVAAFQVLIVVR